MLQVTNTKKVPSNFYYTIITHTIILILSLFYFIIYLPTYYNICFYYRFVVLFCEIPYILLFCLLTFIIFLCSQGCLYSPAIQQIRTSNTAPLATCQEPWALGSTMIPLYFYILALTPQSIGLIDLNDLEWWLWVSVTSRLFLNPEGESWQSANDWAASLITCHHYSITWWIYLAAQLTAVRQHQVSGCESGMFWTNCSGANMQLKLKVSLIRNQACNA